MNILVIKLTSLGDVLHATGHVRTIRENFPDAHITLLTAPTSADIFRHSSSIDELVLFDRYAVKAAWYRRPRWTLRHILEVDKRVNARAYDLAFDLQGRLKSVIFLYRARACRKYVKGRWWFLNRHREPAVHAIAEMDGVLQKAGLRVRDSAMEIRSSEQDIRRVDGLLGDINALGKRIVLVSPFTRWQSKNWGLHNFVALVSQLPDDVLAVITGFASHREEIEQAFAHLPGDRVVNLVGQLELLEFAELVRRADLVLTGDSFPMHLASALHTPLVALFGPTDENRIGPRGGLFTVLRADTECARCYRRKRCRSNCIRRIQTDAVVAAVRCALGDRSAEDSRGAAALRAGTSLAVDDDGVVWAGSRPAEGDI